MGDQAQAMQRIDLIGVLGQDLAKDLLRFAQAIGLVMLKSELKRLGNGKSGHGQLSKELNPAIRKDQLSRGGGGKAGQALVLQAHGHEDVAEAID